MDAGTNIKSNISARVNNATGTVKGVIDDLKTAALDIKDAVDLKGDSEPKGSKGVFPGKAGERGSIPATLVNIPFSFFNRAVAHRQKFADINRNWLK